MFPALRRARGTPPPILDEPPHFFAGPAILRAANGHQLVVAGVVRSAATGAPIVGARIVRWHANPAGVYEDAYRALMITDGEGAYQLQTIVPGSYAGLPRHIHFQVSAPGFVELSTQIVWPEDTLPPALNALDFTLYR
jgi:protocatechuate 3,4-dioxygenase beta subunit